MSSMMANVFNVALILLENCVLIILTNSFFTRKRPNIFVNISLLAIATFDCLLLYFIGEHTTVKLISTTVVSVAWVYFCYDATLVKCIFTVFFWEAFLAGVDSGLLPLLSTVLRKSSDELMREPNSYFFICFSIKTAELLGIVIIHTWIKRHLTQTHITFLDWMRVMAFPVGTFLVSVLLLRMYYLAPEMSLELAICSAIILLVDIVSIFLLNFLEEQQKAVRDNVILRQSMKTGLDNVEAWRKAYDGQRKQTHDFQNQLLVIHGLIKQQAPTEEVLGYIERLQHIDLPSTMIVKTRRTAVDIILNQKYAIAESRNIRFRTQLDDLSAFPLPDDALITVLANLIDNAIEACEKIENVQERYVSLNMKVEQHAAFLHIENPTAAPVHIKNNRIYTTKKNPLEHGYGLQNIIYVLEQYRALYLMDYDPENKIFSFSAQIDRQ